MASFAPTVLDRRARADAGRERTPRVHFLGIGVQKAGTTWLHRALAAHPEVFMAEADDKDLRFFNAYYDRGYEWYERHFKAAETKRCGEFSTSYFYSKDAPERVRRYNPSMRLVLSLRDPVQRMISQHRHEIRLGRLAHDVPLQRAVENNPSYVEQSRYFTQLSRWLEWFPLSSFSIVIFEELFRDPAAAVRSLYTFVGVSPSFVPETLHEKVNAGRIPRSRLLDSAVGLSASGVRLIGGGRAIAWLKKAGADAWVKGSNARPDNDMEIDEAFLDRIRAELAAENAKLAAALGRDLSVWEKADTRPSDSTCRDA